MNNLNLCFPRLPSHLRASVSLLNAKYIEEKKKQTKTKLLLLINTMIAAAQLVMQVMTVLHHCRAANSVEASELQDPNNTLMTLDLSPGRQLLSLLFGLQPPL